MFDMENGNSHMPFVTSDGFGGDARFCCIMVNGKWKLHCKIGSATAWKRIRTGLPEDATECAPTAQFEDGIWKISFIAGGFEGGRPFKLYRMYGLKSVPVVQEGADVGFVRKDTAVFANRRGPIYIKEPEYLLTLHLPAVQFLYRVSYLPERPNMLLISGKDLDDNLFSWAYLPRSKKLFTVTADGVPAYKCAIYRHRCYYAKKIGTDFEDRKIVTAGKYTLDPLPDVKKYISEEEDFIPAVTGLPELT